MSIAVIEERREVHCLSASLSEHDFESVGGASGLEGFRLMVPSSEKKPLPCKGDISEVMTGLIDADVSKAGPERDEAGKRAKASSEALVGAGGICHGVESS